MKNFLNLKFLCLFVVFLSFLSCKDSADDAGLKGLNISMASRGIQSITKVSDQSSVSFKFDKTSITKIVSSNGVLSENVTYSANGKIASVERTVNENGSTAVYNLNFTNTNGQLTKIKGSETIGATLYDIEADFTYDTNGKLAKVFAKKLSTAVSGLSSTKEINYTYSGDNVAVKNIQYLDSANGITTSTNKKYEYSSYDGNKNPFGRLPYDYEIYSTYFEDGFDTISNNNYSQVTITTLGQSPVSKSFVYTYNSDGTPLTKNDNGVIYLYAYQDLN